MSDILLDRTRDSALTELFGDLLAELSALRVLLPSIYDSRLHDHLGTLVAFAPKMVSAYCASPGPDIAATLLGLRGAAVALSFPARDPAVGTAQTLRRVREAKGLIVAAAEDALKTIDDLGWTPAGEIRPRDPAPEVSRAVRVTESELLIDRLRSVAADLDSLDVAGQEPAVFGQMRGLLRAYIPPMRIEIGLARLHLTVGERIVDLGALTHATAGMDKLTVGFIAALMDGTHCVSEPILRGAAGIRGSVTALVTESDTITRAVLDRSEERRILSFPAPDMVAIPSGDFMMGTPEEETLREGNSGVGADARPVHGVKIARSFWLSKYPVTRGEYAAFVADTGYNADGGQWRRPGYAQTDRDPVVYVCIEDIEVYTAWLGRKTGQWYRLPSEAEWEYAARAGTTTVRYWGGGPDDCRGYAKIGGLGTAPVGGREPNRFGLHDMLGNVWEWTADFGHENYQGAPTDGTAWTSGGALHRMLRGGSWYSFPRDIRASTRLLLNRGERSNIVGFRLARISS